MHFFVHIVRVQRGQDGPAPHRKKGNEDETHSPSNPDLSNHLGANRYQRLAPLVRERSLPAKRGAAFHPNIGSLQWILKIF